MMPELQERVAACALLPCTREEANMLDDLAETDSSGFKVKYMPGDAFIYADVRFDLEHLPGPFLWEVGRLLELAKVPLLEFWAVQISAPLIPGATFGQRFGINALGDLIEPIVKWPSPL